MKFIFAAVAGTSTGLLFLLAGPELLQSNATPPPLASPLVSSTSKIILAKVTAYDPYDYACVQRWAFVPGPRKTAINADAEKPGLAADFDLFPPGTIVTFPNTIGSLAVDDTGEAMRVDAENSVPHFDLRMVKQAGETAHQVHMRAEQFGVQWINVHITPPNNGD